MRRLSAGLIFTLALALVAAALFAEQIGLDNDPGWGSGRYALFFAGLLSVIIGLMVYFSPVILQWLRKLEAVILSRLTLLRQTAVYRLLQRFSRQIYGLPLLTSRERRGRLAFALSLLISVTAILWYSTAGTFTHWFSYPHTYYDRLAQAFRHGQLALLDQPDASLTSLSDPYPFENRQNARYLWDVSYYQGRFYLYWGPTPALVLAGVKSLVGGVIEDQALVVGFLLGIAVLLVWIAYRLWQVLPSPVGARWLLVFLPALSLNLYLLWPTGRPGVYEAAILGGQFFLLGGIAALVQAVSRAGSGWGWYLTAGLAVGLAIGSRMTLAVSALWLVLMVVWLNRARFRQSQGAFLARSAAFCLPILFSLALLMAYNAARFGNPLESGLSYQLGIPGYPPERGWLFSARYLLPNLYHYLLRPPVWRAEFPYVFVPFIPETRWPWFIRLPQHYIAHESQAGWLWIFPVLLLIPAGALLVLRRLWLKVARRSSGGWLSEAGLEPRIWLLTALLGSGLGQTGVLLLYFFPSMRFQIELLPLLALSAWLTFLWLSEGLQNHRWLSGLFSLLVAGLALYSLTIGLLGGLVAGEELFANNNPLLFRQISSWFRYFLSGE
jgi:hypothetical protein